MNQNNVEANILKSGVFQIVLTFLSNRINVKNKKKKKTHMSLSLNIWEDLFIILFLHNTFTLW